MKRVGIILVNYNGFEFTKNCVQSLEESTYKNITIYIVDNGSIKQERDRLWRFVAKNKTTKLLIITKNCGLSKANNVGLEAALADKQDFLWLLNNDTLVRPDAVMVMLTQFSDHHLSLADALLTSTITFSDGMTVWSNGMYDVPLLNFPRSKDKKKNALSLAQENVILRSQYASSCSLMVHRDFCKAHGLTPDEYFIYYDDLDWSSRGVVHVVQQPLVTHLVSATGGHRGKERFSPFQAYWNGRNAILFYFKRKQIPFHEKCIFLCITIWIMMALYVRDTKTLMAYFKGLGDGLCRTQ